MNTATALSEVAETSIRVMLADDHPVVRDGLAAIIELQPDMGVIGQAEDGLAAIELFESLRPDVLVLDLRMPRADGLSVVKHLIAAYPDANILVMTTYDGDEDVFQCLSAGAKGYLLKDAPRADIHAAIRALAIGRQYTSPSIAVKALQRLGKPSLTPRELDVLRLLAEGRSNKDVGRRLGITEGTAKTHVKTILEKLDAMSRTEAVAIAQRRGFIRL